jgi:hypothetical protein
VPLSSLNLELLLLEDRSMNPKRFVVILFALLCLITPAVFVSAQEKSASPEDNKPAKAEAPAPRTKDGKKLLTALDLMKIAGVSSPRISPDGARVV